MLGGADYSVELAQQPPGLCGMLRNKDGIKKDDIRIMDWCY
jgi:hypothetical protein